MGRALLSKSLIQFSVDGQGCVLSLLFDLRPNYGGGNEDTGDLLQKIPCTHCCNQGPRPCSRPLPTHASTRDSWTLTGKSGSDLWGLMESLLLSPGSWCAQGFVCALQESVSPVLCKFCWLCGGVNGGLMPYPGLLHPEPLPLQQSAADLHLGRRHSNTVLSQSLYDLWVLVWTGLFEQSTIKLV